MRLRRRISRMKRGGRRERQSKLMSNLKMLIKALGLSAPPRRWSGTTAPSRLSLTTTRRSTKEPKVANKAKMHEIIKDTFKL